MPLYRLRRCVPGGLLSRRSQLPRDRPGRVHRLRRVRGRVPGERHLRRRRRAGRPAGLHSAERRTGEGMAEHHEDQAAAAGSRRIQGREGQAVAAAALSDIGACLSGRSGRRYGKKRTQEIRLAEAPKY
ncbi:protein of unknown function [Paraburkholderia kururiensis]